MDNEKQQDKPEDEAALQANLRGLKASKEGLAMLLPYIGPHLKWLIYAGAVWLIVYGISEGISKVWTANKTQQHSTN
jgi:hypothetical protein